MHRSGNEVSFWSAVSIGIGSMVGAGIFALLGEAGAIAGSAVWISFLIGGVIALLSHLATADWQQKHDSVVCRLGICSEALVAQRG